MKQRENRSLLKNYKLVMAFILGLIVASGGVYAATTIAGSNITYSNSKSGLSSTNVQGAIDELYEKADIRKAGRFVAAYTYNETGTNKCITGEESTCKKTTCYKTKTAGSCPSGTIIKYKVNDTDIVNFHVMFDNGNTMTMQSQKNTINSTEWVKKGDYVSAGGTESDYGSYGNTNKGPLTILPALENATKSWSNVNNQTYTLGTTNFSGKGAYTGCSEYNSCTTNTYTLASRTAKARMITVQEAASLGCTSSAKSCPIWMYNYLSNSTVSGGTINDSNVGDSYWTSSAAYSSRAYAWNVNFNGGVSRYTTIGSTSDGARAVVEVSK